jgi:DNA-binding transcriptional regulator PaaX
MAKKQSIQKAILRTFYKDKVISADSVKKGVKGAILGQKECTNKDDYAITRSMKTLLSDGLIESFNSEWGQYFRLTTGGKRNLNNIILEGESTLVSTESDGYWRIILLDLPEERKSEREALRYLLKKAGFACVKNSVWISMYPFEHLFTNIKKDFGLSTELIILVTDKLDEETKKEFFSLCGLK